MSEPTAQESMDQHLKEARAEVEELRSKLNRECSNHDATVDRCAALLTGETRLAAELDAVRKDAEFYRHYAGRQILMSDFQTADHMRLALDTAQARCTELERAIQEAPHGPRCLSQHSLIGEYKPDEPSACDCWKSRISPDHKPALKGGGAGMFTKAPPMKGAADVQSESRPASPDHGKAGEWLPIETCPENQAVLIHIPNAEHYGPGVYRAMLVNMGTGKRWLTSAWACGRGYTAEPEPNGWQPLPAPPTPGAKQSEEGV